MATFTYTARDKVGAVTEGSVAAPDRASATSALSAKGLVPILVKEAQSAKAPGGGIVSMLTGGNKVKLMDKVIFSRQFSTMINAGVPIAQSLGILREQSGSKKLASTVADLAKRVEGGSSLAAAMAEHTDVFPPIYVNMVRAGETGGILDEVLERLATQQEKDAEIVGKVKAAMIYPAVITCVTVIAFVYLMTVIVPKLAVLFEGIGGTLPIYTRIMLAISKALTHYGVFIAIGAAGIGFMLRRYIKTPIGKKQFDTLALKVPVFGNIIAKVNIARFARTFGSLMASGITVLDAINATSSALSNQVYQDELKDIALQVKNGKPMSEPIKKSKNFPPIVAQMIAVGEETGQLDEILLKLAGFYEREVDNVVAGITSIIEPILIIVLGGMVGAVVISVFGPIASISQQIK